MGRGEVELAQDSLAGRRLDHGLGFGEVDFRNDLRYVWGSEAEEGRGRSGPFGYSAAHAGDRLTREVIALLRQTFLTPFDRSDIHALVVEMDDRLLG